MATEIFNEMKELGLGLDRKMNDFMADKYDLLSFAELREYLSDKELEDVYEQESRNEQFIHLARKIQKYETLYGNDRTKWPKEILDEVTNDKIET